MKYIAIVCFACLLAYTQQKPGGKVAAKMWIDTTHVDSTEILDSALVEMRENLKLMMQAQGLKYQERKK